MKIALVQINTVLADFTHNQNLILEKIAELSQQGAELIIFPEACLFGYHPFDLLERHHLVDQQNNILKNIIKKIPQGVYVLLGGFEKNLKNKGRPYYNSAFLCTNKKVLKTFQKELLPTGDVFDEARFIEKGSLKQNYFKIKGKTFFLTICEDIWAWENTSRKFSKNSKFKISQYVENPIKKIKKKKVDLVINMSASPFFVGKDKQRQFVCSQTAKFFKAPMAYVNLIGAQDEIIYDGRSLFLDKKGQVKNQLQAFATDELIIDLTESSQGKKVQKASETELIRQALVLGIKDFCGKTKLKKVHLGLSGGIDSAVVACLAQEALGSENVKLFALPTQFNLPQSYTAAETLADNLGSKLQNISIQSAFESLSQLIEQPMDIREFGLVHENLQSRIRGLILMAYSNATGSLLLTTGNKSEYATGYATLYGDMCGGLAPIGDLTKKQVFDLARLYNKQEEIIPAFIINRPPSAELRPNQKDQDSLPDYNLLDSAVKKIVQDRADISNETEEWLFSKLMLTEFKRWQAAPILKISEHAFGRGRRYPIAHRAVELSRKKQLK